MADFAEDNVVEPELVEEEGVPKRKAARKTHNKSNKLKQTKKSSEWEIEQRRKDVLKLRMRGLNYHNIATTLGISVFTVRNDLAALQKEAKKRTDNFQAAAFVGEVVESLDDVIARAWEEFNANLIGTKGRTDALRLIQAANIDKLKVLIDVGLVSKVAQEVKHKVSMELPWDEGMKQAVIHQMLQRSLKPQNALPTPDPDHGPGKQIEVAEIVPEKPESVEVNHERTQEVVRSMVAHGLSLEDAQRIVENESKKVGKKD